MTTKTKSTQAMPRPMNWLCGGCECSSAFCAETCPCRPIPLECVCTCDCPDAAPADSFLVLDENPGRRARDRAADELDYEQQMDRLGWL